MHKSLEYTNAITHTRTRVGESIRMCWNKLNEPRLSPAKNLQRSASALSNVSQTK